MINNHRTAISSLYLSLFLLLSLLLIACKKHEDDTTQPEPPKQKIVPQGSRKVNIKVDSKYDFTNVKAYSFNDSTLIQSDSSLIVPNNVAATLYFADSSSGDFLAVVRVDSSMSDVEVNATSVSIALFELIPTYNELTAQQQREFETQAITLDAFKRLVTVVEEILKNRSQIFSTNPDFINSLSELNKYILSTFLAESKEGERDDRVQGIKKVMDVLEGPHPDRPETWILQKENMIENQVHSYIRVSLASENNSKNTNFIMSPRPFLPGFHERKSFSDISDGYYEMEVTHKSTDVELKNGVTAAEKMLALALGSVLDKYLKANGSTCREELANKLAVTLHGILIHAKTTPTKPDEVKEAMFNATFSLLKDALTTPDCARVAALSAITRFVAIKASWITATITVLWDLSDLVQMRYLIEAFVLPIDHVIPMQIHHGVIIPGQFTLLPAIKLKEKYKGKEKVPIQVSLKEIDNAGIPYKNRELSVNWIVKDEDGTISDETKKILIDETTGSTDGFEWFGNALWTLPSMPGTFKISVEIRDKNNDHIKGSPIEFTTNVVCDATDVSLLFVTDGSWKASHTAITGWTSLDFDDQGWISAGYPPYECLDNGYCDTLPCIWGPIDTSVLYLRKTFTIDSSAPSYCSYVFICSSDDNHELIVNGNVIYVDDGLPYAGPVVTTDITPYLKEGDNVISVKATDASSHCAHFQGKLFGYKYK